MPPRTGLALVGNPGAGKSTILNGIAGSSVFKSGINLGCGLTSKLQTYKDGDVTLYDTPGLSDIDHVKQAGAELDALLRKDINLSLCFVVTLERGRTRPDDANTIEAILTAIRDIDLNNRFGVILNQLSPRVKQRLDADADSAARVRKGLTGKFSTTYWHYVQEDPALVEEDNQLLMNHQLSLFLSTLPSTKPRDATTQKIDTASLEEKKREHEKRIREVEAKHRSQMQGLITEFEQHKKEQRDRLTKLQNDLRETDGKYKDLKERHMELEGQRETMTRNLRKMEKEQEEMKRKQVEAERKAEEQRVRVDFQLIHNEIRDGTHKGGDCGGSVDSIMGRFHAKRLTGGCIVYNGPHGVDNWGYKCTLGTENYQHHWNGKKCYVTFQCNPGSGYRAEFEEVARNAGNIAVGNGGSCAHMASEIVKHLRGKNITPQFVVVKKEPGGFNKWAYNCTSCSNIFHEWIQGKGKKFCVGIRM